MEHYTESYYKKKRDINLGDKPLAVFYQILILQEVNNRFSLRKKETLRQLWDILNEMMDEFLGVNEKEYRIGICMEVLLAAKDSDPSAEEYRVCNRYFYKSQMREYVHGIYQIHIRGIQDLVCDDAEVAQRYADHLLRILEGRYGIESMPYAKMRLHIAGEYIFQMDKEAFFNIFRENYQYFRQYTMQKDMYFFEAYAGYIYLLGDRGDAVYDMWLLKFQEDLEQREKDEWYGFMQCKIAWVQARILEKKHRNEEGFLLIQNTIQNYMHEDIIQEHIFYAYVYLTAAYFSQAMLENEKMLYYAKKGLDICERQGRKDSELYYNLYNYIGIWHMRNQDWAEAEKLYSKSVPDIVQRFGQENENYVIYMSNLLLIALNRGRDATPYMEAIKNIKSDKLKEKYRLLRNNGLNFFIARGDSLDKTRQIYKNCISNLREGEEEERSRLDTLYVSARTNAGKFDAVTEDLLKRLEGRYKERYADEQALIYWNSRCLWEWHKGKLRTALETEERLMCEIKETDYLRYIWIVMNDLQLLMIHGEYELAERRIFSVWNRLDEKILQTGFGNLTLYLNYMRSLSGMYIYLLKQEGELIHTANRKVRELLEMVMRCKTIEREIKGLIGKYSDDQMDLHYYKLAHRKLAALENGRKNFEADDYKKKKQRCLMELGEYESSISERIPYRDLIHPYTLEEIKIPQNAICAEYYAYYRFEPKKLRPGEKWEDDEAYDYLVFVIGKENGKVKILEAADIVYDDTVAADIYCLLDAASRRNYSKEVIERSRKHLKQKFAAPVLKYAAKKDRLYLGVDFELQMLPVDLIFYDEREGDRNNILVDSVCYVEADTEIDMGKQDSLIVGNPKFGLHVEQKTVPLPCGELECARIADMLGVKAYVGWDASPKALWGRNPKNIIHISTHGVYMMSEYLKKTILYDNVYIDSFLMLAGYDDWKAGKKDKDYGNGSISGEDFLFMDLSGTDLIVLSACMSGYGSMMGLGLMHGMRWAISAAGARNSVTALWGVEDDATAVLMLLFYRNLFSMPVGEALYQAKRRLREITVAELRADKDFLQIIETASEERRDSYWRNRADEYMPFSEWRCWAGFVCYHR